MLSRTAIRPASARAVAVHIQRGFALDHKSTYEGAWVSESDPNRVVLDNMYRKNKEAYNRHKTFVDFHRHGATRSNESFVAPSATIVGAVHLHDRSSVWYGAVIRADSNFIRVGYATNIQDNAVIQSIRGPGEDVTSAATEIGNFVTVGHDAIIMGGAKIGDLALIGMGSVIGEGAKVGRETVVAANAVVGQGVDTGSGQLWAGVNAKPVRDLSAGEKEFLQKSADEYWKYAQEHAFLLQDHADPSAYREVEDMLQQIEKRRSQLVAEMSRTVSAEPASA